MSAGDIQNIVVTASAALAIVVAAGTVKGREEQRAAVLARMQADIAYIKEKIDHHVRFDHGRREEI